VKILFAGPSLHRDLPVLRGSRDIAWHGPARCGDIARAVREGAAAIGLVDGLFDQNAAPWHKEILYALSRGVRVAGGASMGALRAAECDRFGMVGIGRIYRDYAVAAVTDDADVAQLHGPAELDYLPLTEPWVNVAPTLALMAEAGPIRGAALQRMTATARRLHFSQRSYREIVRQTASLSSGAAEAAIDWFLTHAIDQKRIDAHAVLDWLREQPDEPALAGPPWRLQETTQWLDLLRILDEAA
jgi:hypothetical protein